MNIFKNKLPCSIALILIITVILSAFLPMVAYAETDSSKAYEIANEISSDTKTTENVALSDAETGYKAYLAKHQDIHPEKTVSVSIENPITVVEDGQVKLSVIVEEAGLYNICLEYIAIPGRDVDIEFGLQIDGEYPFKSASTMELSRVWEDTGELSYVDDAGNEYLPVLKENEQLQTAYLHGQDGYEDSAYSFWFDGKEHTITLIGNREAFELHSLKLCQEKQAVSYEEYVKKHTMEKLKEANLRLEGEDAKYRSHSTLYANSDMSSCANSPYNPFKQLLNTVGGNSWSEKNEWLEWEFDTETAGYYELAFRVKQNYKSGSFSVRKLLLDGEVPFAEASNIRFNYNLGWTLEVLGNDDTPYYLWLDAGKHTIRLEVAYGDFSDISEEVQECVQKATSLYRRIMMITGSSPDTLRDYKIENNVPGCKNEFKQLSDKLYELVDKFIELSGKKGSQTAAMEKLALQLSEFADDTEMVPRRLSTFSTNISSLAAGLVSMTKQPLLLDYMELVPMGGTLPEYSAPWYKSVWNEAIRFFFSFIENYDNLSSDGDDNAEDAVTLWLGVGKDQSVVLYSLIQSEFCSKYNIPVNLRLISQDILLRAVAVGKGPDLAIYQSQSTVINYALRNAAYDLNRFDDIEEVKERFHPEALKQYTLSEKLYALPEQMNFHVMFLRTDIMDELGITVPKTWDDLYDAMAVLQQNNMQLGVTSSFTSASTTQINPLFLSLLYQNGGEVYDEDGTNCILNQAIGVQAFTQFSEWYTKHSVPLKIDLLTRFRTGETPIVLNNFSFANELSVSAPELSGMWEAVPLPGVYEEDGILNNSTVLTSVASGTSTSTSTGVTMFSNAKNKENTWEFMKWWTNSETQSEYARRIEGTLGRSGRWLSANIEATQNGNWSKEELAVINNQLETLRCLPEVAGGYYTGRSVNNALRTVVNNGQGGISPKETLYDYVKDINREIQLKRKELDLD